MPANCPSSTTVRAMRRDGASYASKFARVILDSVDRLRD